VAHVTGSLCSHQEEWLGAGQVEIGSSRRAQSRSPTPARLAVEQPRREMPGLPQTAALGRGRSPRASVIGLRIHSMYCVRYGMAQRPRPVWP
jgi:hypothetical protein